MKKFWKTMTLALVGAFAIASCGDDVPAPSTPGGDNGGNDKDTTKVEVKGTGTVEDPFNAAAANAYIATLAADTESDKEIYVAGTVVEVKEPFSNYGNTTFYLADNSTSATKFYVFRAYGLGNKKCTNPDALKVGDEVVVCGKVINYKGNTPETVQNKAYVYSINGKTEEGNDQNTGEITKVTIAEAIAVCNGLEDGKTTSNNYQLTDVTVTSIFTADVNVPTYGNINLMVKDAAGDSIKVWYTNNIDNKKFTSAAEIPAIGATVTIVGPLTHYVDKSGNYSPEMINGWFTAISKVKGNSDSGSQEVKTVTAAEALDIINGLADGQSTTVEYIVSGTIESIEEISTSYGNATFNLEGGLKVFRCKDFGGEKFTSEDALKVGDRVKVQGLLQKYVKDGEVTPEVSSCKLVELNGKGNEGNDDNKGDGDQNEDGIVFNAANDKAATGSDAGEWTITKNGVTITCSNGVGGNGTEYRIYKSQTLTVTAASGKIASVKFECTADNDTKYGPGCFAAQNGYTFDGKVGTWTGEASSVAFTADTNQVRATKIVVALK